MKRNLCWLHQCHDEHQNILSIMGIGTEAMAMYCSFEITIDSIFSQYREYTTFSYICMHDSGQARQG